MDRRDTTARPQGVVDSSFSGATDNYGTKQYGIAFDVEWTAPADGDYLVITGNEALASTREVLLVMDGRSAIAGKNPVSINSEQVLGSWLDFEVYYLPAKTNRARKVTLSDFRWVEVDYPPGAEAPDG